MKQLRWLLKFATAMLAVSIASAQLDTASMVGTVLDPSGSVIPNANIVVENQLTGAKLALKTDALGNFTAPVLQIGTYRVLASAEGFKSRTLENYTLRVS